MKSQKSIRSEARHLAHHFAQNRDAVPGLIAEIAGAFSKEAIGDAIGRVLNRRDMDTLSQGNGLSPAHTRLLFENI
jgi:hypothetical protein